MDERAAGGERVTDYTMHEDKIRRQVEETNTHCCFGVTPQRVQEVHEAICAIYLTRDKLLVAENKYDEISSQQGDRAITLFQNCCAYGLFDGGRSFIKQAAYLTAEGHFWDIIAKIESGGTVNKQMIMEWFSRVALKSAALHQVSEDDFDMTIKQGMMKLMNNPLPIFRV